MRSFLLIILFACVFACDFNTKTENTTEFSQVIIDYSNGQQLNYSQIFESCEIVALETKGNNLIGSINEVILSDKYIIVLDNKMAKAIFIFDHDGKLISQISNVGKGPGEYMHPKNVLFLEKSNQIIIYDSRLSKVLVFDIDGTFKREVLLDQQSRMEEFFYFNNEYLITRRFPEGTNERFNTMTNDFVFGKSINIDLENTLEITGGVPRKVFFNHSVDNLFIFKDWYDNRLLVFNEDLHLIKTWDIRFPGYEVDFKYSNVYDAQEVYRIIKDSEKPGLMVSDVIIDSDEFILFGFNAGVRGRIGVIEKKNNSGHFVDRLINDMDKTIGGLRSLSVFNNNSGFYIHTLDAFTLKNQLNLINDQKVNIKLESPYKEKLEQLDLDDSDNPVLFIYKLKNEVSW